MAVGIIMIAGAFGMGFAYGYGGSEEDGLLIGAIVVEILGDVLFFSGLVIYVKAKRGMDAAKVYQTGLHRERTTGLQLAGVSPLLFPRDPRSGGGLALEFVF
jgi:hypothetical protein